MENIPRIEDAYIDSIIKSAGAYQPSLIKTQGIKLRELLKLFRDRFEQEVSTISESEQHLISSLSAVATSGKYSDLTGKPTNLTEFANDLGNYGDFAKNDGTNVTGTWNLNISGNAATAGNSYKWGSLDGQYLLTGGIQSDGLSAITGVHSNGYAYQFNTDAIKNFLGLGSFAYKNSINGSEIVSGFNQPPSTDIGTAQTLRWKNYGNSHVIFDASQGTSPSGTAVNSINPQNDWVNTYPTLMGWNGSATYGVRVDSAKIADSANGWFGQRYMTSDGPVNTYIMAYGHDGQYHPTSSSYVQSWLGLGSGAYTDKTQLWSSTHPNDFYISNSWDGTFWQLKSNHGSPVNVGHADDSTSFNGASVDKFHRYGGFGSDANAVLEHTSTFTYQVNAPANGTLMHFGAQGYGTQFNTSYSNGNSLSFRTRNGDNGIWNSWYNVWHNGNLNPSVSAVGSSVVQRTAEGYITNNYFNSSRADENDLTGASYLFDLGDGYMRKKSVYHASFDLVDNQNRHHSFINNSAGTGYTTGTLELINGTTRPSLGLHWAGVVASTISIEASGRIAIMNNPGTAYENLVANVIYANSDLYVSGAATVTGTISGSRGIFGFDTGIQGSVNASNWFRSGGATGWYNNDYMGGIHMSDAAWVRVFGGKGFLVENVVMATEFHATSGGFYDLSDAMLKEELDQKFNVRSIKTRTYIKAGKVETGYFAQDVEVIMPHSVVKNNEDHLLLNYNQILVAKVANLEEDIAEMQKKINLLSKTFTN